jgi:hypothetical protein
LVDLDRRLKDEVSSWVAVQQEGGHAFAAPLNTLWALPELIEAAVRSGNADLAAGPMVRLTESTQAGGTDFGLGIESRSRDC